MTQASIFITYCILWNTLSGPHKPRPRAAGGPRAAGWRPLMYSMLRGHIVMSIAIRSSDEEVKPDDPLGAFREEQAMSRHRVSPSPFLSSSSHTTQLHYTNSYTYIYPKLNFLQYTIQILVPHVMWSAQVVRDLKIDHTQLHLSVLRGTRSA